MPATCKLIRLLACLCAILAGAANARAQSFTVIHDFTGGSDGMFPSSGLLFDAQGNLYGITSNGGNRECSGLGLVGCGTVYTLAPSGSGAWTESVIHVFSQTADGGNPAGTPVFDSAGNLYGTTTYYALGSGAVWELSPGAGGSWNGTVVHAFSGTLGGFSPTGVSFDGSHLLGATFGGGPTNDGLIYALLSGRGTWQEVVLYNFQGGSDGNAPAGPLTYDAAGNVYGTTYDGGPHITGTVFELVRSGGDFHEQILYTFQGLGFSRGPDGTNPTSGVIIGRNGNLYGTTYYGGAAGVGTVFELSRQAGGTWQETVLYTFKDGADGGHPNGLITDGAGNLYGTTAGHSTPGSVFRLSRRAGGGWEFGVLHDFSGPDGEQPVGTLALDGSGNLYGATAYGGAAGSGVVFEITP